MRLMFIMFGCGYLVITFARFSIRTVFLPTFRDFMGVSRQCCAMVSSFERCVMVIVIWICAFLIQLPWIVWVLRSHETDCWGRSSPGRIAEIVVHEWHVFRTKARSGKP